ncbi:unnamed protein product, partial [marine sediment metagenome]
VKLPVLDVGAKTITDEMCIVAANSLAKYAEERGMSEDDICPRMNEQEAYIREAVDIGMEAQKEGIALIEISREELRQKVEPMIKSAKEQVDALVKAGLIAKAVTD